MSSTTESSLFDVGRRYKAHWSTEENSIKPLAVEKYEALRLARRKNYEEIARDYYDLATDNIRLGWNPSFHFCPFPDPYESIDASLKRHQHYLALWLGLRPDMRGLDCGCGIGPVSRELVRFANVHITGISINALHVEMAKQDAREAGLEKNLEYVEGDFMDLSRFPSNTFDFAYATEATVYAPDLAACYREIARVLKPGGMLAIYEWCLTDRFDARNPRHLSIRQRLERGDGITNLLTLSSALSAFRASGLQLIHHEDRAESGLAHKKWWYCINGEAHKTTNWGDWWMVLKLKPWFWKCQCALVRCLEGLGFMERGRYEALLTQSQSVWGMRDGAVEGVFTDMYMMVGREGEWKKDV